MGKALDITGSSFGRLTAIEWTGRLRWSARIWRCRCECGNETEVAVNTLRSGLVRSCGCMLVETSRRRATKHGQYGTPAYKSWDSMVQRCTNPRQTGYARYGAVGVTVCERWRVFENFLADMGERPNGMSLDRIDNARGYEPGNCRWATGRQQRMNQGRGSLTEAQAASVRKLRSETGWGPKRIAEHLSVPRGAVSGILYLGNLSPL